MDRFAKYVSVALICCCGCGRDSQPIAENPSQAPAALAAAPSVPISSATDVVSQFLDEIRRGGQDSTAHLLLTSKAQSELKRIGRTVQPIGSPDARFRVTRAEGVPDEPGTALVHTIWSEPMEDGSTFEFQVVWAVAQEAGSWRISGLATEMNENQPPMIIDFENGEMMARLLAAPDFQSPATEPESVDATQGTSSVAPARAAVADPTISR